MKRLPDRAKDIYLKSAYILEEVSRKERAFYVAPQMGCDIANTYLGAELGSGYEWWKNFYEFHKLAIDELEACDYEEYKNNGFKVEKLGDYPLKLETKLD